MSPVLLYVLIAVFLLLAIALVWFGLKTYLDMKNHAKLRQQKREEIKNRIMRH